MKDGSKVEGEMVLEALGRIPKVKDIGLEEIGVLVEKGAIKVDDY